MEQFPPPPPSWSQTPPPPPPPPAPASESTAPPPQPPIRRVPAPKKAAWKVPVAIAVSAVAVSTGIYAVARTNSSTQTVATTTSVTSTTSTTALVTTVAKAPTTSDTIASIASAEITEVQFAGIKSVIQQISQVDVSPYEDCIRQAPYTLKMTDATLLVCVDDPALRLQYIKAALDRSGLIASSPPAFIDCYEAAIVTEDFSALLSNPVGVGKEADAWAIDQFTSAGLDCSKSTG
jgi:hypothetical protein